MLSLSSHLILLQLPLLQAGQLIVVVGISFALITLIASCSRFNKMTQVGEEYLTTTEDYNDFFFIQIALYLSKINRTSSGFILFIVQFQTSSDDPRAVQKKILARLKQITRSTCDKPCLFRDDCVATILDAEESCAEALTRRLTNDLKRLIDPLPEVSALRAGASSFPQNGVNTQAVIDSATNALEQADFKSDFPFQQATAPKGEESPEDETIGELSREDKRSSLDLLTGVLKPEVIGSYMRKYLAEIRQKKGPATLLCIGINRIDDISRLHGEDAADAAIAGVSKIIQELSRDCDLIGRYHRDDFAVLAPCSLEQGKEIALRIRDAVQKASFPSNGKPIKTSISIGVAAHPEQGRILRDLFRGAYAALEKVREWGTSSCLVYDPQKHTLKKGKL